MLILPIQDARPGMKLAMTVTDPAHPETELLTAGYPLDEVVLGKLHDLGISVLYVAYPDLSDLDRHLAPYLTEARREIYGYIRETIATAQTQERPTIPFASYYSATRSLITALFRQGKHPVYLEEMLSGLGADGVRHAAAVAHLAMVMGIRLESYVVKQRKLPPDHAREITNLGVAGMLHDIGKTRIPERLRHHTAVDDQPATLDDAHAWQSHPTWSYEMIRGGVEASAAAAVLHHHQHFDGSGFPVMSVRRDGADERVEGLRIHVFGRILLAADLYERLTLAPDGRRRATVQILHLMRTKYAGRVDPQILRVLPSIIPPYPPGAVVTLSDGTRAAVVEFHPREPYYPTVRRLNNHWILVGPPFNILPGAGPVIASVCGITTAEAPPAAPYGTSAPPWRKAKGTRRRCDTASASI